MNRQEDRMYHSEQFMPEIVDEQIDQFSRLTESETVNGQFINDLDTVCKEYIERRDRVWARVEAQARDRFSTEQMGIIPSGLPDNNFAIGQQNTQQKHFSFFLLRSRRTPLELIAAVLIAVLVVGSMLWLVGVTHPFTGGTIVASGATSSQASGKPVISGQGIIYPNQEQDIQYPKPMYVAAVNVSAGQEVKVGQTLMQLYPADNAQVQGMYNKVLAAEAQLKADQVNHPERVAADQQQVAQAQSYLTRTLAPATNDQIQLVEAKVKTYQAMLTADQASHSDHVAADQQQLQLAESELNQLLAIRPSEVTVTSSISGVVTQVNVDPVKVIAANTPMLTVMDESTAVVHAKVPQAFLGKVHTHQMATVTTSALSGRSLNGLVTKIIPTIDPKTHTFEVWISVPNSTQQLLAGMSAQVQFQVK